MNTSSLVAAALALAVSACASLAPSDEPRHVVRGPLPYRVQHPFALTMLDLVPRRPVAQGQGEIGTTLTSAYTSIFEEHQSGGQNVQFDGELWRNSARLRFGMGEGIDLETDIAFLYASGGFLDHFISQVHDFFNFPNQGRETVEDNQYDMRVQSGGETIYELESNTFGMQDVPLIVTFGEPTEMPGYWNRALRLGIELPWGSESQGFGNGGPDYGVGLSAERSYGRTTHHISANVVFPSRPDDFVGTGVHVEDIYELVYGFEYRWTDTVSWIAQVDALSPMITDIQFDEIDSPIVDIGVGFFRDLAHSSRVFMSFHDDIVSETGPDFTLMIGWTTGS